MASAKSFQWQPSEEFDLTSLDEWPQWKWRIELFCVISDLSIKPKSEKVNALIYFTVDTADDIFL